MNDTIMPADFNQMGQEINDLQNKKLSLVNLTGQLQQDTNRRSVIGLISLNESSNLQSGYCMGSIQTYQTRGRTRGITINLSVTGSKFTSSPASSIWTRFNYDYNETDQIDSIRPCTFNYEGKRYIGLDIVLKPNLNIDTIIFYGVCNSELFGVDYWNTQLDVAINTEIAQSINYETSITIEDGRYIGGKRVALNNTTLQTDLNTEMHNGWRKFSLISQFGGLSTDSFQQLTAKMPDLSEYIGDINSGNFSFIPPGQTSGMLRISKHSSDRIDGYFRSPSDVFTCHCTGTTFSGWDNVSNEDLTKLITSNKTSLVAAINEVKQDGSDWKRDIADAITAKWIKTSATDSRETFVKNINSMIVDRTGLDWEIPPLGNHWTSIAYGNNRFVAVGKSGNFPRAVFLDPADPYDMGWNQTNSNNERTNIPNNEWTGIAFGNGLFVAVARTGNSNRIMFSTDGFTWNIPPNITSQDLLNYDWVSIVYSEPTGFVAISEYGDVAISQDGLTWRGPVFSGLQSNVKWKSLVYGDKFVAIGQYDNTAITVTAISTNNAESWYDYREISQFNSHSICYGNGQYVLVGQSLQSFRYGVFYSDNGTNWDAHIGHMPIRDEYGSSVYNVTFRRVFYGNNRFILTTDNDRYTDTPLISEDLSTWERTYANGLNIRYSSVESMCYAEGLFVGFTDGTYNTVGIEYKDDDYYDPWGYIRADYGIDGIDDICYGAGKYVAIYSDTIMVSEDSVNWTMYRSPVYLSTICYANDMFVAVGDYNSGVISTDGINWEIITLPSVSGISWKSITWGKNMFVVVGHNGGRTAGGVITSIDGRTWVINNASVLTNKALVKVTFGNGVFVAIAYNNRLGITSTNGVNWSETNLTLSTSWTDIAYGNGRFVAVSTSPGNTAAVSTDGITWTISAGFSFDCEAVAYGNGMFLALPSWPGTSYIGFYSFDGLKWEAIIDGRKPYIIRRWAGKTITYGNGKFVAGGSSPTPFIFTSGKLEESTLGKDFGSRVIRPGVKWVNRYTPTNVWTSVTHGKGIFVAVGGTGSGNRVMTSYDGVTWTSRSGIPDSYWVSVTYGNNMFVAVAESGTVKIMTSPDGITWTPVSTTFNAMFSSVTYANNMFVAVGYNHADQIAISSNGVTWQLVRPNLPGNPMLTSVTFGNNMFVAVGISGNSNIIITSTNGSNWTVRPNNILVTLDSVTFGGGKFVAVGSTGLDNRAIVSTDGINWKQAKSVPALNWKSVTYGGLLFVAVANNGIGDRIMISPDGEVWTSIYVNANFTWQSVCYGAGIFVVVASNGVSNSVITSGID